jgi:hypothetical protein
VRSFRENHWRGLADHHTMTFPNVVTDVDQPDYLHDAPGRHRRHRVPKRRPLVQAIRRNDMAALSDLSGMSGQSPRFSLPNSTIFESVIAYSSSSRSPEV